ncbi:cbb3-type cytochrome oxidase subunit 3 [Uliginosibacterium sediminicola]|uniref:CcoQ/FixQ family Cbb3-type cytochrome c oxidase assembly chaperone n=1 Tax=Uliginosibacterium sediminicola TaxID=2024550 RepID=A0ABU9Z0V7_9RHOO
MDINTLRSVSTVMSFFIFIGLIWWAFRPANAAQFQEASMLPFALDEMPVGDTQTSAEGQQR